MNTAIAKIELSVPKRQRANAAGMQPLRRDVDMALTRLSAAGAFSLLAGRAIEIEAEPGLIIRVSAGCVWVPHHEEQCSVGVAAGERFVVRRAGRLAVMGSAGAQVELEWPARDHGAAGIH